ncbi:MAG TPA: peptidoglycan-binding domain-containing protein [Jatrophihabitans sp.]|jgi:hypothetical protein|uniref:peptidoglycan-binding domain-containing protein n=1 Tax=Jatrophihabitans sp. TaxID=1932789 RepID=UPI002E0A7ECA|nr:peptidoglycan-binding domain-containing protein [Jatrophihabitans sp.]
MPRLLTRSLVSLVIATLAAVGLGVVAPAALATAPRIPAGLPTSIEPMADYVEQTTCDPHVRPGTLELARLLAATYGAVGSSWNSTYACGTDGTRSEHYDGRAIDWMVSVRDTRQNAAARATLTWLLSTDKAGNRFAMARRLGIMYIIFDNKMWGAWDGRWADYNGCSKLLSRANDNACHRTHMHISLGWNGAMGRTSFWTRRVAANTDFGPCRPADLNWAPRYTGARWSPCADYSKVSAASSASATKKALVKYSGAELYWSFRGPAVMAVQAALHIPATGVYDMSTVNAVKRFQAAHHLPAMGPMYPSTWRALLKVTR